MVPESAPEPRVPLFGGVSGELVAWVTVERWSLVVG